MTIEPADVARFPDEAAARAVLGDEYGVDDVELTVLAGGLDRRARTLRVDRRHGPSLVLRVAVEAPRPAAVLVPRALTDAGVTAVVAPVPARSGDLVVRRHELAWTVSPYVEGENGYAHGMSHVEWSELGAVLRAVHAAELPRGLMDLVRREHFGAEAYLADFRRCNARLAATVEISPDFMAIWHLHRPTVIMLLEQLSVLAGLLRSEPRPQVVCHGDLHPGNVLVAAEGVHLIDWDDVILAPRERDLIFVPGLTQPGGPTTMAAFLAAYDPTGSIEVDWPALTYYRCERVVQDVLVEARHALAGGSNDEHGPTYWFEHVFQAGGEAEDAIATAQALPAPLNRLRGAVPDR